jgi:hypothetical protein
MSVIIRGKRATKFDKWNDNKLWRMTADAENFRVAKYCNNTVIAYRKDNLIASCVRSGSVISVGPKGKICTLDMSYPFDHQSQAMLVPG